MQNLSESENSFLSIFSALIECISASDHIKMTFFTENSSILVWKYSIMNSYLLILSLSWQIVLISFLYQCFNALNTFTFNDWIQWIVCEDNVINKIQFFMQNSWNNHVTWLLWSFINNSHHLSELNLVLNSKWIVNQWYFKSLLIHLLKLTAKNHSFDKESCLSY